MSDDMARLPAVVPPPYVFSSSRKMSGVVTADLRAWLAAVSPKCFVYKANAYFSGIGGKKSIVLFDTLLDDHSHEELLAILAHEIGHYKKKHILYSCYSG